MKAAATTVLLGALMFLAPTPANAEESGATCVDGNRSSAAAVGKEHPVINEVAALTNDDDDAAVIVLRYAPEAHCAWAWIGGQPGAALWIDRERVANDGGIVTEVELGRREIQNGNGSTYGGAYVIGNGTKRIRACGQVRQAPTCTPWFDGVTDSNDDGGAGPSYVALGDSFSAGEGAPADDEQHYLPGTDSGSNLCHRSNQAYSVVLGHAIGADPQFVACSGAKTVDYWNGQGGRAGQPSQRDMVNPSAKLVTLSFGGNNIGFAEVAANCAALKQLRTSWSANCLGEIADAKSKIDSLDNDPDSQKRLGSILDDIHARAPGARLLVMGYPKVFPDQPTGQCSTGFATTSFLIREMLQINDLAGALNSKVATITRARISFATYVDVSNALQGHDLCAADGDRWINRFTQLVPASKKNESYHPNVEGQAAFAERMLSCYRQPESC